MGAWFENLALDLVVAIAVIAVLYGIGELVVAAVR